MRIKEHVTSVTMKEQRPLGACVITEYRLCYPLINVPEHINECYMNESLIMGNNVNTEVIVYFIMYIPVVY